MLDELQGVELASVRGLNDADEPVLFVARPPAGKPVPGAPEHAPPPPGRRWVADNDVVAEVMVFAEGRYHSREKASEVLIGKVLSAQELPHPPGYQARLITRRGAVTLRWDSPVNFTCIEPEMARFGAITK